MKSIRLYLLLALLATITLVNFVSLLHGYQSSMEKAQQLFDSRLESTARLIASANSEQVEQHRIAEQQTPYTYFQIWGSGGRQLLTRSRNAPEQITGELEQGFHDINHASYRWRNFVYRDQYLNRWIVVAERIDVRYTLAEEVVLESLLPIVMAIPVSALIIWIAVGIGLKPLRDFAEQIRRKRADDLSPIELKRIPKELTTVVHNTNALLLRLDEAFEREQRFSADAAHELRTPISVLKVHLHNLRTRLGNQDEDLNLLREGVERMGHLIEQILALYRTSPDQAAVKFEAVDLYSLAQNLIARDFDNFERKQQTIELEGEHTVINANAFALETLLHNLLTNANKYTPAGGQICVAVKTKPAGCLLSVEDSGPGIPAQQHQRVFERFYRLHGDQHFSGVIGCGLGLTIVKHIVDLHQGQIELGQSRFEHGLKVTVYFPSEIKV
ncbi:sensor histidine kinase [Methylophaga sp. OBS4]|uniref:sensor histidine kinase n=1 Tax=Methylophaga sp. OBS4 TaxID=2991935 RepID=UPI0022562852|nr:ATP-binding protein [Methylophaga sp. OBS4]MCX4186847.1 ATP-binding protein [Methylophaga sp. OBS4]